MIVYGVCQVHSEIFHSPALFFFQKWHTSRFSESAVIQFYAQDVCVFGIVFTIISSHVS